MKIEIVEDDNKKWSLMGTFEIGKSGEYEQRILCSKLSRKKAEELKEKYNSLGFKVEVSGPWPSYHFA